MSLDLLGSSYSLDSRSLTHNHTVRGWLCWSSGLVIPPAVIVQLLVTFLLVMTESVRGQWVIDSHGLNASIRKALHLKRIYVRMTVYQLEWFPQRCNDATKCTILANLFPGSMALATTEDLQTENPLSSQTPTHRPSGLWNAVTRVGT